MIMKIFYLSLFSLFASTPAMASPILEEGHYESARPVCAYNIVYAGEGYYAEGSHSSQISCRDAGTVILFEPTPVGTYLHNFGRLAYEWTITSPTSFIERVKRFRDGRWVTTTTFLFRLQSDKAAGQ